MIFSAAQVRDVGWGSHSVGWWPPHASLLVVEEASAQPSQTQSLQQDFSTAFRIRYGKSSTYFNQNKYYLQTKNAACIKI